ncbi:MAG: GNAT family N-acetyltransferase [Deltaproteobacteria bacterium]
MPLSFVVPATVPLQEAALALLFSTLPAGQRRQQLADTLAAVGRREMSLDNLLVALDGDRIVGTVLAVLRPGGAAFLWPPVVQPEAATADVASALLEAVASRIEAQGAQFLQCLLDPADAAGREALNRGGIPYATDLILLSRSLVETGPNSPGGSFSGAGRLQPVDREGLCAECYSPESHAAFSRLVERTYVGTLDCPVLAGVRGGEESLEAHRATGQFVPNAWRLYREAGEDVGVLLLAEHPERDAWEVAYLGVIPEARGRGFGRAILYDGLALARRSGRSTIEIAVDAANAPALRLYRRLGFSDIRRFAVHLRVKQ